MLPILAFGYGDLYSCTRREIATSTALIASAVVLPRGAVSGNILRNAAAPASGLASRNVDALATDRPRPTASFRSFVMNVFFAVRNCPPIMGRLFGRGRYDSGILAP